ncbi:hypothetical protein [Haloprofundus salilacus]|uniref:hypothetical protein n=1 Tax=Haloprofundus salilacus TaxID=2876190 RepID=UPI001CCA57C5|nr:hypothetical protein [Haloprofundus salilacus]
MSTQSQLDGKLSDIEEVTVFYRPVQSRERLREPDQQSIDSQSELVDVQELVNYIKDKKLDYPMPLKDSNMNEMTSDRVRSIFESDAADHYVKDLLGLFCSTLEGRQKSKDKFAMLVYLGDQYLLAHSRAKRGMSLREGDGEEENESPNEIKLIKRFLDVDNILSAALFEQKARAVQFAHFTDSGSDSFRGFLGVNEHQLNYRRKTIQILCYYRGRREYSCKFEFTNDEFSDKWLRDDEIEFSGNKLHISTDGNHDRPHEVKEIRWGNNTYESIESFKSDFKQESLGLDIDEDKYDNLHSYPSEDGSQLSVYDATEVIDHQRSVEVVKKDGERELQKKSQTPDNLHVIYSSSHIRLDSSFADDIFTDIVNQNEIQIYHPSTSPAAQALTIGKVTFLNIDREKVSSERIRFLEETYMHALNRTGETVRKCLLTSMMHVLRESAEPSLGNALSQIINIYTGNPSDGATVSTKENEGIPLIEYKNKLHLEGDDPAAKIISEIETEDGKGVDTKVILWGFTEQSRVVDGFSSQSWNDDRISNIENVVRQRLQDIDLEHKEFMMQPIPLDTSGERMAITGVYF